ncbi:MAG: hypothetical protein SNH88_06350 [Rikenellaceae bacterium]
MGSFVPKQPLCEWGEIPQLPPAGGDSTPTGAQLPQLDPSASKKIEHPPAEAKGCPRVVQRLSYLMRS